MTPYYEHAGITIYHGDCREVLPALSPVDLVLTDLPYGVGLVAKTNDFRDSKFFDNGESLRASVLYQDDEAIIRQLVKEVMPVIFRLTDRCVLFSGIRLLYDYPRPASIGCVYVPNGAGRDPWGFGCFQPILYYGKDPYLATGQGSRPNSFSDNQPGEKFDHPCPKPLKWMNWLVTRASLEGEMILDPFTGTGTTLVAAKNLNRSAIGIEIEEKYCEIAAKRLSQEVFDFSTVNSGPECLRAGTQEPLARSGEA